MWDKIVIFAADNKRKEEYECSINELAERMTEKSQSLKDNSATVVKKKYRISPRMKQLMGSVSIDPNDVENDDKLKYILNK